MSVWRRWESTLIPAIMRVSVKWNLRRALNEEQAGAGWVEGSRLLRPMQQCGLRLNTKHHLPCIWAVATKQSIILPFQKIEVTYLKEQRIERIIKKKNLKTLQPLCLGNKAYLFLNHDEIDKMINAYRAKWKYFNNNWILNKYQKTFLIKQMFRKLI